MNSQIVSLKLALASVLTLTACSSDEATDDKSPPQFAGCTAAQATGPNAVTVSWNPATDDQTPPGELVYNVYVAPAGQPLSYASPPWTFKGKNTGDVLGLRPDTEYVFVCRARDRWINEDANEASFKARTHVDPSAGAVTFKRSVLPILRDTCAGACHVPGGDDGKVWLTDSVAYTNLTTLKSAQVPTMKLVEPGKPLESYLWVKLSWDEGLKAEKGMKDDFMPPEGVNKLPDSQLNVFKKWIEDGAKDE